MLLVKTKTKESNINGLGCFADEFIPKGTLVWTLHEPFDLVLSDKEYKEKLLKLPPIAKDFIKDHSYEGLGSLKGKWVICTVDSIYINHSPEPTLNAMDNGDSYAQRDIEPGEELTCDYFAYSTPIKEKLPPKFYPK